MSIKVNEIKVKSILNKTNVPIGDYAVNPYVGCAHGCKYCYASFMKRFTNHKEPWGEFVDVKFWEPIKNPSKYDGKILMFGTVTDPYQPLESKYKRTRVLLEELKGSDIKLTISTRSDLILRDLDLIKTFKNARVSFSINTLDEEFKKDMDKGASIERRLNAMKELYKNGIYTSCFISPIFPEITDVKKIINKSKKFCNFVWLENLNLRGDYKARILKYIKTKYPKLTSLYEDIYNNGDRTYWEALNKELKKYAKEENMLYVRDDDSKWADFGKSPVIVNYFYHEEVRQSAKKK